MKKCDVKYALMAMEYKNYSISLESVPVFIASKCYVLDEESYFENEKNLGRKVAFPYHIFWDALEFKYNFVREEGVVSTYLANDLFDTLEEACMAASIQNHTTLCQYMSSLFEQGNEHVYKSFQAQHQAMCNFFGSVAEHLEQITDDIVVTPSNQEKKLTKLQ